MPKKKKSNSETRQKKNYSGIEDHTRKGKVLLPPFATLPNFKLASWRNERLPEFLWACILVSNDRESALDTFRKVVEYIVKNAPDAAQKISHSGLSELDEGIQKGIISVITNSHANRKVLHSLLLFDGLPARKQWENYLPKEDKIDIAPLLNGVARTLEHQSQEATDCRWLRVVALLMAGKLHMHDKETIEEIIFYPKKGDIKKVRPTIRAMEGAFSDLLKSTTNWPINFWEEALKKTECYILPSESQFEIKMGTTSAHVNQVYQALGKHMCNTFSTSTIDPKHDTTFGLGLYSLSILNELLRLGNATSILAREGLRTITECLITLNYLTIKNDESLWQAFRVYGAGQTKLAFIKLDELDQNPSFVDKNSLQQLANEDMWLEYLNINLGNWNNTDLRNMSIEVGLKDIYDKYYPWTSSFGHGNWGAVRDTVFETCGNPLHRLHRIPRNNPRMLPDVILDTCFLIDKILEIVSKSYPDFDFRVTLNQLV